MNVISIDFMKTEWGHLLCVEVYVITIAFNISALLANLLQTLQTDTIIQRKLYKLSCSDRLTAVAHKLVSFMIFWCKSECELKLNAICMITIFILFRFFSFTTKSQHCQFCVLWKKLKYTNLPLTIWYFTISI